MSDKPNKEIVDILKRLERLEKAVFATGKKSVVPIAKETEFAGPKGGVSLLISEGFFSQKKTAAEVIAELEGRGYLGYQKQVFYNVLNRLSAKKGQLTSVAESGTKVYAKRK